MSQFENVCGECTAAVNAASIECGITQMFKTLFNKQYVYL